MLRSVKDLKGYKVSTQDGGIGKVIDLYFDDQAWITRYLVADTGRWLPGRKVLIPRAVMGRPDWDKNEFHVGMTKEQIENGPSVGEDEPVSRQHESDLHNYLHVDPYWARVPGGAFVVKEALATRDDSDGDPNLRSTREVVGYHIQARDGEIGHVEDLIVDDETWTVRYMVVDTKNLLPGKKVLVAPTWIDGISWSDSKVAVDMTTAQIKDSPEYTPSAPVNRELEERLYDYYGRPYYWR
jgi:sporulation protein YlmC with PRC-barrel domain